MSEVARFDAGSIFGRARFDESTGFLHVDANVTRTGVLTYRLPDGTTRRELRHPEQVFDASSLDSLKLRPTTNDHPYEEPRGLVTSENAKRLQVGQTGESISHDARWVKAPLVVTDGETIDAIKRGRRQLSCGYTATLVREDGEYEGQRYDHRQTNIRYNHVAHVDHARVGAEAAIRLDAGDAIELPATTEDSSMSTPTLVSVMLDGIAYQAAPEVERALSKVRMDAQHATEKAKADLDAAKGREDALQAKLDAASAKIVDLEKRDAMDTIRPLVKARVELEKTAARFLPSDTKLDEMSDGDIRKAVILAADKNAKLDGKSDAYLEARFDSVVEAHPEGTADAIAKQREQSTERHDDTKTDGMTQAQMTGAMRELWKQPYPGN